MTECKIDMTPRGIVERAIFNYRYVMKHPEFDDAKGIIRRVEKLFRSDWFAKHFKIEPEKLISDLKNGKAIEGLA